MSLKSLLILAALVAGVLFFSTASATAGTSEVQSTIVVNNSPAGYELHGCFCMQCEAEAEVKRLKAQGYDSYWRKCGMDYCVYKK